MEGRIIAVSGAAGALGRAVVAKLAEAGATVAALDRAPEIPAGAAAWRGAGVNLGDPADAQAAFARLARELGGLDGLVNVAGGFRWETVEGGEMATWDLMYEINVRTALAACRAALPHLRAPGSAIVNVGAAAAAKAAAGMGAYAAAKSGVARLTESLAEELKDRGVRVNAVLPSILDTPANRADMPKAEFDRWVAPEALADVIVFLLSDQSRAVTGALLPVTGRV